MKNTKPLGRKAYGSIGHLPSSRLGKGDHSVPEGQAQICTVKTRDRHDRVIVQEKLDGSCTAVAMIDGAIVALGRAGYLASTSPYEQHRMFATWAEENEDRFREVLREGERLVGEWLAQAHGTRYDLLYSGPWAAFDLMQGAKRIPFDEMRDRVDVAFRRPVLLHDGGPLSVVDAMTIHETKGWLCESTEGIVYRVERRGEVDFLAKWVKPDKVDGKYLPEISGEDAIWNWRPLVD